MPDIRSSGGASREPADGDQAAALRELLEEGPRGEDLEPGRTPVRRLRPRVGGHDVPAQGVQLEFGEDPLHDRGRRLRRSAAAELTLRGERQTGDPGTAIAGGLTHEKERSAGMIFQIGPKPAAPGLRARSVTVEVERRADARGREAPYEPFRVHIVTMLMRVRGRTAALVAACAVVGAPAAAAAPPQGFQSNASFSASYAQRGVTAVAATSQRVSCYAPEVFYLASLTPSQGYPDGGTTLCNGAATTGEDIGPYPLQDLKNPPARAKDFSESDLHVDPTNPRHLIGVSKWIVNAEGYNHLTGFFESFDGGATWPQQGHIPGYEAWTDNSDPVGAFDPWGNFYAVVFPYMFSYIASGQHFFLSPDVNPTLPRSGLGVAVRPKNAAAASTWNTTRGGQLDLIERTPFNGSNVFDKQWLAIDTNRHSRHFGRVYVSWAIGNDDSGLRIYLSYADARRNGTHRNWSRPRLVLPQAQRVGDNGSLPRVAPNGTVWLATSSFRSGDEPFTMSLTSSRNGGRAWARRSVIVRHSVNGYRNTSFRAAFGEAFIVGPRKVGRFYPLYAAYEQSSAGGTKLFLRGSFDGGRHWGPSRQINDASGEGDALQPNLAVAPNGTVAVAFYDRRLSCPARDTTDATIAGLLFDPRVPFGAANYCINTAVQFYRPKLRPIGHNIRLSEHTWDPQLSSPRFDCICNPASFIGDYFGIDSRGGFTYTASVETFNAAGENPGYHQQQLVSKLRTP